VTHLPSAVAGSENAAADVLRNQTAISARTLVAVWPAAEFGRRRHLFRALEGAFPVRFEGSHADRQRAEGLILIGSPEGWDSGLAEAALPTLALAGRAPQSDHAGDVILHDVRGVDPTLRGLVLRAHEPTRALGRTPAEAAEQVLATGPEGPVWARARGRVTIDRVGAALPEFGDDGVLRDVLAVPRALALIALVHFLRAISGDSNWTRPPLRAALVFDDPNLRRPAYGHIHYGDLAAHAVAHGYHVAMAMVPLDARRAHPDAVATFHAHPEQLSLVMHGNNHVRRELMKPTAMRDALALGAQALRRVERFEAHTGLPVNRVMTPPHGLCGKTVVRALAALGYDGLCAIHPSPWSERPQVGRPLAGWGPADFCEGCAVVPRFPLSGSAVEIRLRAFLRQPLVLYAHHQDVAGGLENLAEAASRVNRLPDVRWMSIGDIFRTNHWLRIEGRTAIVRPWAGRSRVTLPHDVEQLLVEPPAEGPDATGLRGWSVVEWGGVRGFDAALDLEAGEPVTLTLRLHPRRDVEAPAVASPAWRPWPIVRRRLAEYRDRLESFRVPSR
jgi:hypothetical protein